MKHGSCFRRSEPVFTTDAGIAHLLTNKRTYCVVVPSTDVSRFLNHEFYATNPALHLSSRIHHLLLVAARGDELHQMMDEGPSLGRLALVPGTRPTKRERSAFVTAEAQTLLHHSAEALLRLFIAHRDAPDCPWVELARLTSFKVFKRRVAQLAAPEWSAEDRAALVPVFLGDVEASRDEVEGARNVLQQFLTILAGHYLDGAKAYNAIKHGFAVQAARHRITIGDATDTAEGAGDTAGDVGFEATGETVTYLEYETDAHGRHWRLTTSLMNSEHALTLASYAVYEIEALWIVAKKRYARSGDSDLIPCLNRSNIETLQAMESERVMSRFSRGVFDEAPSA